MKNLKFNKNVVGYSVGIFLILSITFVYSSILESSYESQPNPSAPATEVFVIINDEKISLQQAHANGLIGGESNTDCGAENYAIFGFDEQSNPICGMMYVESE